MIPGTGISIIGDVISSTLDISLYIVVSELPTENIQTNKIYLVLSEEENEQDRYLEYLYIDGEWELIGKYEAKIDLSEYLKKAEAAGTYQLKGDYALSSDIPSRVSQLTNDAGYLQSETDPTVPAHVKGITQANITTWNNKSTFSGKYGDLTEIPTEFNPAPHTHLYAGSSTAGGSASTAQSLARLSNAIISISPDGVRFDSRITTSTPGIFPSTTNANGLLTINTGDGNHYFQLGFSSDGNLYTRNFLSSYPDSTTLWKQVLYSDQLTWENILDKPVLVDIIPDEEDLTEIKDANKTIFKFKDKEYDLEEFSGLGRVYLRKNIVEGKNILTQSMINKPNTIYIIQYDYDLNQKEITIPENCVIDFHGGSLNNGELIFNNSKLQGDILINTDVAGTIFNTKLKVEWFGAKGDGINDDSISIRNTIKLLNKNGSVLEFKPSTYIMGDGKEGKDGTGNSYTPHPEFPKRPLQDDLHPSDIGREITLRFINYKNLTIEGNGAIIKAHPYNGECKHNNLFYFGVCSFLIINNLSIDGAKDTIIPKFNDYNTGNDIWDDNFNWIDNPKRGYAERGNMYIIGCDTVSLNNVVSNKSIMDGICVGNYRDILSNNINIINCKCLFNYRQGLTLSSVYNTLVQGGEYSFTGYMTDKKTLSGTLPMAGIDIEADSIVNYNINIENVTVDSNYVSGIVFSRQSSNIRVSNSKFINKGINIVRTSGGQNNEVCYNYFENCSSGIYQENLKVHHNIFKFDESSGSHNFAFDVTLDENEECENTSLFSDNIIEVDVSKIEENTSEQYYGCFRAGAPIVMNNNIFKNIYSKGGYAFIANITSAKDNVFINNSEDFPILSETMLALNSNTFTKFYKNYSNDFGIINNKIVGETSSVVFKNDIKSIRLPNNILYGIKVEYPSNKEHQWFLLPRLRDIKIRVNVNKTVPYTIFVNNNINAGYIENHYYISDYTNDLSTEDLPVILYKYENKAYLKIEKNVFGSVDFEIKDINNSAKDSVKIETIPPIIDTETLNIMICTDRYQEKASDRLKESFKGLNVYDGTYNKPLWVNGEGYLVDSNGIPKDVKNKGTSDERPTLPIPSGFQYFDTTLNRLILWSGVSWENLEGTLISKVSII